MKMTFKSKAVVVSNGGKPSIPKEIFDNVPKDKLITADYFLKKDGFEAFTNTLSKNPTKRKIVIIGGSHSGFSSAWVLLNGPACYNYNRNGCRLVFEKAPGGKIHKCKNSADCGNYLADSYTKSKSSDTPKNCQCFGAFKPDDMYGFKKPSDYPKFGDKKVSTQS